VTSRPLHAVLLPPVTAAARLLEALPAALDGTGPALLPLDPGLPPARLAGLLDAFAPSTIETSEGTERLPVAGEAAAAGARGTAGATGPAEAPGVREEIAVVIATSGSTGRPKGAELTAAALLASARAALDRIGAGAGQRWLCCLPTFHMAGLGVLVRSLLAGVDPVVIPRLPAGPGGPPAAGGGLGHRTAAGEGCAHVSLVPTQLRRLLDGGEPVSAFRTILLGGAAPPAGLLAEAAAAGARVITTYGMSETCGGCVYDGVPLAGVSVAVGADELIRIAGPVLFSGYRLQPDQTAAVLNNGWFLTADLGCYDPAGRLLVRGRADDVITTGGQKVPAALIEAALETFAGLRGVAVVGVPDGEWGELVTALVVPADPRRPPRLDELRAHVRDRLPGYAAPRALVLVADIPLLASGKPDTQRLRQLAARPGTAP
jgi:o-succinylbenzoate---CoA ligase